jgi:hypothetical protein
VIVSVDGCGTVRSNVLQRQPGLILRGGVRRESAENDDSDSNQDCREQTYGGVAVDVFHKSRFTSISISVKQKNSSIAPKVFSLGNNNIGNVPVKSVQARARLGRFSGGCRRKSIDANRPDGQPVLQPNARVLQRKITSALVKR